VALRFRQWAFESAALDLALRQAGRSLHDVLGLEQQPLRFVVIQDKAHMAELKKCADFGEPLIPATAAIARAASTVALANEVGIRTRGWPSRSINRPHTGEPAAVPSA